MPQIGPVHISFYSNTSAVCCNRELLLTGCRSLRYAVHGNVVCPTGGIGQAKLNFSGSTLSSNTWRRLYRRDRVDRAVRPVQCRRRDPISTMEPSLEAACACVPTGDGQTVVVKLGLYARDAQHGRNDKAWRCGAYCRYSTAPTGMIRTPPPIEPPRPSRQPRLHRHHRRRGPCSKRGANGSCRSSRPLGSDTWNGRNAHDGRDGGVTRAAPPGSSWPADPQVARYAANGSSPRPEKQSSTSREITRSSSTGGGCGKVFGDGAELSHCDHGGVMPVILA
jgi:hypothetical protein